MASGFEASFPLVFYDGNATLHMGNVFIHPSLNYKAFQLIVSQKIGVSPNQLTSYYERGPLPSMSGKYCGGNRRYPVTSKFNFASILFDRDCFFFIVLKRSRRVRHRNKKQNLSNYSIHGDLNSQELYNFRSANHYIPFYGTNNPDYEAFDHQEFRQNPLAMEKKRYMISRDLNSLVYSNLYQMSSMNTRNSMTRDDGASSSGGVSSSSGFCDICASAKREGQTISFHLCNSDAVIATRFRSPFGPIARPERNRVES